MPKKDYSASRANASSKDRASSRQKAPVFVRTRDDRWAPVPSASPRSRAKARMYVPLEQAIRIWASGRPSADVSATLILEEAVPMTDSFAPLGMTETDVLPGASARGVGQNFFDLFSGEKILVRGGTADAHNNVNSSLSTASSRINVADTSSLGLPEAKIRIACSKGTYIRAFARDLGEALGTGAHLSSLVRTRTGDFRLEDALTLEDALALLAE